MEWKTFNDKYEISENGEIRNVYSGCILKVRITPEGYVHYQIGGKNKKIHRIVAQLFVPNPNELPCVNHKDGNKMNNHYTNLEWCTQGHNMQHAWGNELNLGASKKVRAYKDGQFVGEYKSQYDCARQLGIGLSTVNVSLHFNRPMRGYTFERV